MSFVQRDDVVQDFPAAASDLALRNPVLPWRLKTGALRRKAFAFRKLITSASNFASWSRITYRYGPASGSAHAVAGRPVGGRLASDVEVQDPAQEMLDYKETIQEPEVQRGHVQKSKAAIAVR
jgi:hypothetical protein